MKKIILIVALFATVGNAADMCIMHLKTATKYMELASVETVKSTRNLYIKYAIESDIEAKYACPKDIAENVEKNIKELKKELRK